MRWFERFALVLLSMASMFGIAFILMSHVTVYGAEFPDTGSPEIYDPTEEIDSKATSVEDNLSPGNEVENIEEYEKTVKRIERSSLFDSILWIAGGILFFYAALLILAYGMDRVSVIPGVSLLKLCTFGRYDVYGIGIKDFILRDFILILAGIVLASGIAKKLVTLLLIYVFKFIG